MYSAEHPFYEVARRASNTVIAAEVACEKWRRWHKSTFDARDNTGLEGYTDHIRRTITELEDVPLPITIGEENLAAHQTFQTYFIQIEYQCYCVMCNLIVV